MQGIYNYIPETNRVSTVYSIAAVLYLQSVLHVILFRPWNMFCTSTSALPAPVCSAQYGCFLHFLYFVRSRYVPQVLSEWFWNGSSRPYYYRYHFCFHIPHAPNFYCKVFTVYNLISFFLDHISVYINRNMFLFFIMMSCLLLGTILSVRTCLFHNKIT